MVDVDPQQRIAQLKERAEADPTNELALFTLAQAYVDSGAFGEAVPQLQRVIAINRNFSKAYALLGQCQRLLGEKEYAIATLTQGYRVAQERGDLMPRNEMGALLKELGAEVPDTKQAELTPDLAAAGNIKCKRCGRVAPKMAEQPYSGEEGAMLQASICAPCFREWIGQGTKVINELRLDLTTPAGQTAYDQHMKEFLNLE